LTGRERALYMSQVERHGAKSEKCVQLCSHFAPDETCKDAKSAVEQTRQKQAEERRSLEERIAEQEAKLEVAGSSEERRSLGTSIGHLKRSLGILKTSMQFFEATLKSLDPAESSVECSVCLEDAAGDSLVLTQCGHLFHELCAQACLRANGLCPQCRNNLGAGSLIKVSGLGSDATAGEIQNYGSKLSSMLARARQLCAEDAECKIIVFVQWEGLLKKVHAALSECGLPCLRIFGTVPQRQRTLQKFRESSAVEHRLLLLSLEKSPSGMTLTNANHIFLVHPMVAESPALAAGYERQAIGRVRRPGQEKTVHVWRFITSDTVEEQLVEDNRNVGE